VARVGYRNEVRTFRLTAVACLVAAAHAGGPPASKLAQEALDICLSADHVPDRERDAIYARGLAASERAIAADERDPVAHFAAFCNRGHQLERAGASLWSLANLRRVRRDVDRALELAPDYEDALVGKGSFLLAAPRLFGGDKVEGERLLRRALEVDPADAGARLRLARALADRGARAEARTEAERAAADGDDEKKREVREFLDRLGH
jgi:tetratricopeptide (TPR) repeat protein